MQKLIPILLLCTICRFFSSQMIPEVQAQNTNKPLIFASVRSFDTPTGQWSQLTLMEAFKRLELPVKITQFPLKRAAIMLNAGQIDGDVGRIEAFGEIHKNVVRVKVPVVWSSFVAFSTDPKIRLNGWDSLKDSQYYVEYQRGTQLCELRLPELIHQNYLSHVTYVSQGLIKLRAGRTDVFLAFAVDVLPLLKRERFKDFGILNAGVIEETFGYPYLHKKHSKLVPDLEKILETMTEEGLMEKYRKTAFQE